MTEKASIIPYHPTTMLAEEADLPFILTPFTSKQRQFLLFVAMGATDLDAREMAKLKPGTVNNWRYKKDFVEIYCQLRDSESQWLSVKAAAAYLGSCQPKIIADTAEMATKNWKDLTTSHEFSAKQAMMKVVASATGFTPGVDRSGMAVFGDIVQNILNEA